MRLLELNENGGISVSNNRVKDIPPYAILSHTWGDDEDEVSFQDLRSEVPVRAQNGYRKLHFCGAQAAQDGLEHFWVDTCSIDKTNSTELSEAINSMFNWYQDAAICYVYLSDVEELRDLDSSRWFRRGWTLQELLAPKKMVFYNKHWSKLDTRSNLSPAISRITGIPPRMLLLDFYGEYSVAQVMSWAAGRETTRPEDLAYCLLGILGVNMALIYGEGGLRAFERLQQEFMKSSTDHSLFSWRGPGEERGPFARSPAEFRLSRDFTANDGHSLDFSMTNRGLRIDLPLVRLDDGTCAAVLDCHESDEQRRAIDLKEVRSGVYRRIRCTQELRRVSLVEAIPAPTTIYIEQTTSRTLGRDRFMPQRKGYSFMVDWRSALFHGFHVERHRCPDEQRHWDMVSSNVGTSILNVDASGQYGGLQLSNVESGESFIVVLGMHNWKVWLDMPALGVNETFENAVDEYYHYRKRQDHSDADMLARCRCRMPWLTLDRAESSLASGECVRAIAENVQATHEFTVVVLLGDDDG